MRQISLLTTAFLISGCAYFKPAPKDETYKYLTGIGLRNPKPSEVKEALTREVTMAGGNYQVSAFPYTETYIDALTEEQAALKGFTKRQKQLYHKTLDQRFVKDKTCFHFHYEVLRFRQSSRLKNWELTLLDHEEQKYPMQWLTTENETFPVETRVLRSGDQLEQWLGEGVACTAADPKLNEGFGLHIKPSYVQFPFDSSAKMFWEFPKIKVVKGKEVELEQKKRNYRSYRGW